METCQEQGQQSTLPVNRQTCDKHGTQDRGCELNDTACGLRAKTWIPCVPVRKELSF